MAYNPTLGRWMQQDPMGYVDGMNRHQYVMSSPISGIDPLGLITEWSTPKPTTRPSTGPATQPAEEVLRDDRASKPLAQGLSGPRYHPMLATNPGELKLHWDWYREYGINYSWALEASTGWVSESVVSVRSATRKLGMGMGPGSPPAITNIYFGADDSKAYDPQIALNAIKVDLNIFPAGKRVQGTHYDKQIDLGAEWAHELLFLGNIVYDEFVYKVDVYAERGDRWFKDTQIIDTPSPALGRGGHESSSRLLREGVVDYTFTGKFAVVVQRKCKPALTPRSGG